MLTDHNIDMDQQLADIQRQAQQDQAPGQAAGE